MSFEVFIQWHADGKPDSVPVGDVQAAFGPYLEAVADQETSESTWWRVTYDEQNSSDILVSRLPSDHDRIQSMTVVRPCADQRAWSDLHAMLNLAYGVLYFPAEKPPLLVADESVAAHLPKDMIESLGAVTLVRSGRYIYEAITHASQ